MAIVKWLELVLCPGAVIHASLNEEPSATRRMLNAAMGACAGFADLVVIGRGLLLFMEVKTDEGRQSDAQVVFQEAVEALGWRYVVVRSADEAVAAVRAAGFPTRIVSPPGTPVTRLRLRAVAA